MPDKSIRKGFNILEEVEKIHQKQPTGQPPKESIDLIQSQWIYALRMRSSADLLRYFPSNIWRDLLVKTREFPKHEFQDDISELRQEVDNLKLRVKSLESRQRYAIRQTGETSLNMLCDAYVKEVSNIEIARRIYIVDTSNGLTCWTIVDTEPFDSTLLEPIYDAQVKIYRQMENTSALEFHVLNLSELRNIQDLESILPSSAKLVWQR